MFFNPKTSKTFALATAALLLPAAAHAEEVAFERDGVTYAYTTTVENGRTVITGKANERVPFRLVVRGQRVTGVYNGNPVEFSIREAKAEAAALAVR
jgi:hypothetical protein